MSYTEDIITPLVETLTRTAGLPAFQSAGHIFNLPFWMAEVRHALEVIEGYPRRFAAIAEAQAKFDISHPSAADDRRHHEYTYKPLRSSLSPAQAERLSRKTVLAAERLLDRCLREGLIDIDASDDLRFAMHPPLTGKD